MNMNTELLKTVADELRGEPEAYNQKNYFHWCGAPSCTAGRICFHSMERAEYKKLAMSQVRGTLKADETWAKARQFAGLTHAQATSLFQAWPLFDKDRPMETAMPTGSKTAAVIDHLIETGDVDWTVEPKPMPKPEPVDGLEMYVGEVIASLPRIAPAQVLKHKSKV